MAKGRASKPAKPNRLDKYTIQMATPGEQSAGADGGHSGEDQMHNEEPSLRTVMAAIQDLRGSIPPLEPKLDAGTLDVYLQRSDFRKISEKVVVAEMHLKGLLFIMKRQEE
ncbi:hypothetical protein NDU88_007059 [Pleurodeles waltl]|uniref:Uncharacterized protein n=1 Tax=Pleurodeles waltl TaxID=8319 RepID=A0AAV7RP80_PLEWA|nr:hypothetical protein NDU88_007059 [Pleurodeles waltl]